MLSCFSSDINSFDAILGVVWGSVSSDPIQEITSEPQLIGFIYCPDVSLNSCLGAKHHSVDVLRSLDIAKFIYQKFRYVDLFLHHPPMVLLEGVTGLIVRR